jgi:5-methylcytosine-specific restriction endonuclease McrA
MTRRERIRAKFGGRCSYCGLPLPERWHEDHREPLSRSWTEDQLKKYGRKKGKDSEENLFPACPRCNIRKSMMTVEEFRLTIYNEIQMLQKYNNKYRLAEDFGIVKETGTDIVFYFESAAPEATSAEGEG